MINLNIHRIGARSAIALAGLVVALTSVANATVLSLDMSSLPSAQGWTHYSNCVPPKNVETNAWSISGGALHQDNMGCGAENGSGYLRDDAIGSNVFDISVRARVTDEESFYGGDFSHFGLGFYALKNGYEFFVGIGGGFVLAINPGVNEFNTAIVASGLNTAQYHDYVINADANVGTYRVSVDGIQLFSGAAYVVAGTSNTIVIGDGASRANAAGDYLSYSLHYDDVLAPGALALLSLGLAGLSATRRRKAA